MITCNLMGGLGNQLFQIFATITYGIKSKNQFVFLDVDILGAQTVTPRPTYWKNMLSNLHPFLIKKLPDMHIIRENGFHYNDLSVIDMINRNVMINGYFQSYKYFNTHYTTICKIIGINKLKENLLSKFYLKPDDLENTISIHFRLGDYKKFSDYHPISTYKYYENALKYFQNYKPDHKFTVLFFCENEDIEEVLITINKLQGEFPNYGFIRLDNLLEDWEQMLYMSCCHYNIIANSTFSWWAGYLNSWEDKKVCYPAKWFGEIANIDTKDLCPQEWNKIVDM